MLSIAGPKTFSMTRGSVQGGEGNEPLGEGCENDQTIGFAISALSASTVSPAGFRVQKSGSAAAPSPLSFRTNCSSTPIQPGSKARAGDKPHPSRSSKR